MTWLSFEFLALTVARSSEVRLVTWSEVELESATWTVTSELMKARRDIASPCPAGAWKSCPRLITLGNPIRRYTAEPGNLDINLPLMLGHETGPRVNPRDVPIAVHGTLTPLG